MTQHHEPHEEEQPNWYYSINQAVFGPIAEEKLFDKIDSGKLPIDLLVTEEGAENWRPFTAVAEEIKAELIAEKQLEMKRLKERRQARSNDARAYVQRQNSPQRRGCFIILILAIMFGVVAVVVDKLGNRTIKLSEADRKNPQAATEKLMRHVFGDSLRDVQATEIVFGDAIGQLNVMVRFNAHPIYSRGVAKQYIEEQMEEAYTALYSSELPIWSVTLWCYEVLQDSYGKEFDTIIYKTDLHSQEAKKINWSRIEHIKMERLWNTTVLHNVLKD